MTTCKKIYTDIPWAHRQHRHDGPCALIHGHNWSIGITFGAAVLDANGFVVDFGKLAFLERWIEKHLDHACVFNADDPLKDQLLAAGGPAVWKPYVVASCSCEGMARHLLEVFNPMVREATQDRVSVLAIEVHEDSRNSAACTAGGATRPD